MMNYFGMINPLAATDTSRIHSRERYTHQTDASFQNVLRNQQLNQMKQLEAENASKMDISKEEAAAKFLYQNFLMQQAMYMPYRMNLYSGYNNLYGLYGMNTYGMNSYSMMQNSLLSSMVNDLF